MSALASHLAAIGFTDHADRRPEPVAAAVAPSSGPSGRGSLPGPLFALLLAHASASVSLIASWYFLGLAVFGGRPDPGWLSGWALALASTIPLHAASRWLEGRCAVAVGSSLRHRLLTRALSMNGDSLRAKGVGTLLSHVLEADAIDGAVAANGLQPILAILDILIAAGLLTLGVAGGSEAAVLVATSMLMVWLGLRNLRLRRRWTDERVALTGLQVEQMLAHRTRVTQQPAKEWHAEEDARLARYLVASRKLDRSTAALLIGLPRLYVVAALAGLWPAFSVGTSPTDLALSLGAILFAGAAFERLLGGFPRFAGAWIAWRLVDASETALPDPTRRASTHVPTPVDGPLEAQALRYAQAASAVPVLNGCNLDLPIGSKVLLTGDSGSGKSTLVSLLEGARQSQAGSVLMGGLDRHVLGEAQWRRLLVVAPQYHENHVFSASFAFNLLLGQPNAGPATTAARELCVALGLGPLMERMPAGLDQMVGEQGWRLSHGERTRLFLARALLQGGDCVVLDESFAALDPVTLALCVECARQRTRTLIVVSHE